MKIDIDVVEKELWPEGGNRNIWMILDGARDRRIYSDLLNSHLIHTCLYSGTLHPELEVSAPYLVQLECEDKWTRSVLQRSWGQSWGVFLRCDARIERVRRHLRTLLIAKTWRGERLIFRYYDPRVLRVYLPTCTQEELKAVFGPIQHFYTESVTGETLVKFEYARGKMTQSEVNVPRAAVESSVE